MIRPHQKTRKRHHREQRGHEQTEAHPGPRQQQGFSRIHLAPAHGRLVPDGAAPLFTFPVQDVKCDGQPQGAVKLPAPENEILRLFLQPIKEHGDCGDRRRQEQVEKHRPDRIPEDPRIFPDFFLSRHIFLFHTSSFPPLSITQRSGRRQIRSPQIFPVSGVSH